MIEKPSNVVVFKPSPRVNIPETPERRETAEIIKHPASTIYEIGTKVVFSAENELGGMTLAEKLVGRNSEKILEKIKEGGDSEQNFLSMLEMELYSVPGDEPKWEIINMHHGITGKISYEVQYTGDNLDLNKFTSAGLPFSFIAEANELSLEASQLKTKDNGYISGTYVPDVVKPFDFKELIESTANDRYFELRKSNDERRTSPIDLDLDALIAGFLNASVLSAGTPLRTFHIGALGEVSINEQTLHILMDTENALGLRKFLSEEKTLWRRTSGVLGTGEIGGTPRTSYVMISYAGKVGENSDDKYKGLEIPIAV